MSKASRRTKRHRKAAPAVDAGAVIVALLKRRLTQPDRRSHDEFLHAMRAKQAAGQLVNPATAALLERMERAIASPK